MLRVVEHGEVRMVPTNYETYAVDTAEDLERVKLFMKENHSSIKICMMFLIIVAIMILTWSNK